MKYAASGIALLFALLLVKMWVGTGTLIGGDLHYLYQWSSFSFLPFAWDMQRGEGMGGNYLPFLWNFFPSFFPIYILRYIFSWEIIERLVFFYPYIVISFLSAYLLSKKIFLNSMLSPLSGLLFTVNTYILMVIGGGQMPIALAYAVVPFVVLAMIRLFEKPSFRRSIVWSLLLTLQSMLDVRIFYITLFIISIYVLLQLLFSWESILENKKAIFLFLLFTPSVILILLHSFWLLPLLFSHTSPSQALGATYNNSDDAVRFFSFGNLSFGFGLLHPSWPENIFGKVGFMKSEFLLLPIIAFSSLLCINRKKRIENVFIIFFILLGVVGTFLSKGANEPFGQIYLLLYNHVPGFSMFRDPTKWYVLIALSYAFLIPFTLQQVVQLVSKKISKGTWGELAVIGLFFVYFSYLFSPLFLGNLKGTFKSSNVPNEYKRLDTFLRSDTPFSRTLWIPTVERYGYYSPTHPAVVGYGLYNVASVSGVLENLKKQETAKDLQERSIKYVVVPYDVDSEIFLKDRKYDSQQYQKTVSALQHISWLREISGFGRIHVFVLQNQKDHFWIENNVNAKIIYQSINPTKYMLTVENAKKGDRVVFTDSYDKNWQLTVGSQKVSSLPYNRLLNSFILPKDGNYSGTVYFTPQKWVDIGVWISGITLFALIAYLLLDLFYTKRHE